MALIPQVPLKEPSSVSRNIVVKALLIGLLALLLLIPTAMVMGIISDRESRRDEAVTDITNKWGKQQTLLGPVLSVPYTAYITEQKDGKTVTIEVQRYANFLPAQLNIKSSLAPEKRYRSIFEVVVYNAATHAEGYFGNLDFASLNVKPEDIDLKGAVLTVGISDLTGIDKSVLLDWNTLKIPFNAGSGNRDVVATGIHTPVPISSLDTSKQNLHFAFDLQLKGSDKLAFTPVGKVTDVQMTAPWATPSFDGNFLPDDRKVTDKDFTAHWNVLHLNLLQHPSDSISFSKPFTGLRPTKSTMLLRRMRWRSFACSSTTCNRRGSKCRRK